MMKNNRNGKTLLFAVIMLISFFGCKDEIKHFQDPPWLGGSSIEVLEADSNYSEFIKLMDTAGYRGPITKQLFDLFVPDNAAFEKFFKKSKQFYSTEKKSVADLSKNEAIELFTLHMIGSPRNTYFLIYETAYGELERPQGEYVSFFHRKLTNSYPLPYSEVPMYNDPDPKFKGARIELRSHARKVALFSKTFMKDFNMSPDGSDYLFMYPESNWSNLMNWHNAMMVPDPADKTSMEKLANRTSSGFIYYLDQVCEPSPSIERYIMKLPQYSTFYRLMQRFANYGKPIKDKQGKVFYYKSYNIIPNLASETGPIVSGDEFAIGPMMLHMFTLFAPRNEILDPYLKNTFLKYYPSTDSIPLIALGNFLTSHIYPSMAVKSKMLNSFYNIFGDKVVIKADDLKSGYMCNNGVVYDFNRIMETNMFSCVSGELFYNPKFTTFLYLLDFANVISNIATPNIDVTVFAASNEEMEKAGIRYVVRDNIPFIQKQGKDTKWYDIKTITEDVATIVKDYIHVGKIDDFSGDGYLEMSSGTFVKFSNNTLTGGINAKNGSTATILNKTVNPRNGILYLLSEPIQSNYTMAQFLLDDPEYSMFTDLMTKAGFLDLKGKDVTTKDVVPQIKFVSGGKVIRWTAFIPTNTAMTQAISDGIIPATYPAKNQDSLIKVVNNFIYNHFIPNSTIFDDGNLSGLFNTNRDELDQNGALVPSKITISNTANNLQITDHSGQVIPVLHSNANHLVRRGVVHKISSVIKY